MKSKSSFTHFYEQWNIRSFTYALIISAAIFLAAGIYIMIRLSSFVQNTYTLEQLISLSGKLNYLVSSIDRTIDLQESYLFFNLDPKIYIDSINTETKISARIVDEIRDLDSRGNARTNLIDELNPLVISYFQTLEEAMEKAGKSEKMDPSSLKVAIQTGQSIHSISLALNEKTATDIHVLVTNLQMTNSKAPIAVLIGLLAGVLPLLGAIGIRILEEKKSQHIKYSFATTRDKLAAALASMTDAVFISDTTGNFVETNDAFSSFYKSEDDGKPVRNLDEYAALVDVCLPNGEVVQRDMLAVSRALRGETEKNMEVQLRRKDTGETWAGSYSFGPIRERNGTIIGAVVVGRDITDQKRIEREIENQLKRLDSLHEIDLSIIGSTDLTLPLKTILSQVIEQLQVNAVSIRFHNEPSQTFSQIFSAGFANKATETQCLKVVQELALYAIDQQKSVDFVYPESGEYSQKMQTLYSICGYKEYCAVPLIIKGDFIGVLEAFIQRVAEKNSNWYEFLTALAGQASIAIDNYNLFHNLKRTNQELLYVYDATIEGWSNALDMRDKETEGHSRRVAEMTERLAIEMGVPERDLVHIKRGALLHDIGKLGIPDSILLKAGALTAEEWATMKKHPQYAFDLLSQIKYLEPAIPIPYCHHERWDGSGYPRGLKGEQIPLAARIFAVVDVWDALSSDRPYRKRWPVQKVNAYLRSLSGIQFDPKVVEAFMTIFGEPAADAAAGA